MFWLDLQRSNISINNILFTFFYIRIITRFSILLDGLFLRVPDPSPLSSLSLETNDLQQDMNATPVLPNPKARCKSTTSTGTTDIKIPASYLKRRNTSSVFASLPVYPVLNTPIPAVSTATSPNNGATVSTGTKDWEAAFLEKFLRASISSASSPSKVSEEEYGKQLIPPPETALEAIPPDPLATLPLTTLATISTAPTRPKLNCHPPAIPRRYSSSDGSSLSSCTTPIDLLLERKDSVRAARSDSGVCLSPSCSAMDVKAEEAEQIPSLLKPGHVELVTVGDRKDYFEVVAGRDGFGMARSPFPFR